jgi:TetR/AcrR family transcriptional regulator, transcriptional repressor for nem operon
MPRPKEFDDDTALLAAVKVFSDHGFEGASTDALIRAMGIGRQSLYDTFGDKWRLYLKALQRYTADSIAEQISILNGGISALKGLEAHICWAVNNALADPSPSCLGISAICEFGRSNAELSLVSETANRTLLAALERRISEAKQDGAVGSDIDPREAAGFFSAALVGIKVAARAGASSEHLRGIARMTLRSLR